ncbi:carboxypeptidase-like regulatory domain-containing protein [Actinomadura rupiterrae]|uniref:carboxypeptidase-like regulatory domain-containing protein n=1 Tax=Actinomadura rupiterrae TaxID=559627 RepID=UPI0020A4173A|nr:carboxypeptidase-like regulatory domain-containing protein [Actinomadura rupiterrae]MCP2338028.1 hypothetical protein [Actinomadura rupiterrae]
MRRSLAALVSLFTLLALLPLASPASAASAPVVIDASITTGTNGKANPQVILQSFAPGTTVDFKLRLKGSDEPYATFPNVPLGWAVIGRGAVWQPKTAVDPKPGRTYLDIRISDPSGSHTDLSQVTFTDSAPARFVLGVGGGGPDRVTKPFGAQAEVTHTGGVSKIVARLYRAGTDEQVGEDVTPTVRQVFSLPGGVTRTDYMTGPVFDPPSPGEYEVAFTAWDDQGDSLTRRTSTYDKRLEQRLVDVHMTPDAIDYDHPELTIGGRVTDAAGAPLAGVQVSLDSPAATTTTAEDGSFALRVKPVGSGATLSASDHGDYGSAWTGLTFPIRTQATRVSITPVPSASRVGDKISLSGLLERQTAGGGWVPFAGRQVKISFTDDGTGQTVPLGAATTGSDGRYSWPATVTGSGTWRVDSDGDTYVQSSMAGEHRRSAFWTRVVNVSARPNPVAVGGKVTVSGQILRNGASGTRAQAGNVPVTLTFSPDGKRMFDMGSGRTDAAGRFSLSGTAKADGEWWVYYAGGAGTGGTSDEAVSTPRIFVDTRYKTAISSFNASPEPVKKGRTLTVRGRITKFTGSWQPGAGAALKIYFKARGASSWKVMGTATADRNGWFGKGFTASVDGTWAAAYAGSSTYLGVWSAGDYVDVR